MDGLKGFPEAIETVYPKTTVQLFIVHMVRASLNYVNWKERKLVAWDLKSIYRAASLEEPNAPGTHLGSAVSAWPSCNMTPLVMPLRGPLETSVPACFLAWNCSADPVRIRCRGAGFGLRHGGAEQLWVLLPRRLLQLQR